MQLLVTIGLLLKIGDSGYGLRPWLLTPLSEYQPIAWKLDIILGFVERDKL